jgi:hypothetical protein
MADAARRVGKDGLSTRRRDHQNGNSDNSIKLSEHEQHEIKDSQLHRSYKGRTRVSAAKKTNSLSKLNLVAEVLATLER